MDKAAIISEVNRCLDAAKRIDSDNYADMNGDDAIRAMLGYGLMELAEKARPLIPATIIARDVLRSLRDRVPSK